MLCPWQRELQKFFQQPPVSCVQICLPELMLQTQWGHNLVWHRGCFVSMGPPTHVWHTISSFSSELSNRRKLLPLVQSYILHLQCRSHAHIDVGVNMEYCPGCLQWKGGHSNKILFDTIVILSVPWGKWYKQSCEETTLRILLFQAICWTEIGVVWLKWRKRVSAHRRCPTGSDLLEVMHSVQLIEGEPLIKGQCAGLPRWGTPISWWLLSGGGRTFLDPIC